MQFPFVRKKFFCSKKKPLAYSMLLFGAGLVLFALAFLLKSMLPEKQLVLPSFPSSPVITIINQEGIPEETELEAFLIGVLSAEMPASFELEALKAQAIAARTYIVNNMDGQKGSSRHKEAVVCCDFAHCQAYYSQEQLQKNWGKAFNENYAHIAQAVKETAGQIMLYDDEVINALYFSTCGGQTINAEDYWGNAVPYLKGVECGFCTASPRYNNIESFTLKQAASLLGCAQSDLNNRLQKLSARNIREKLGLYSAKFSYEIKRANIIFQSRGSGHGVGLCQYGADGMAKEGYAAEEILQHYYTDIEIINIYQ